MDYVNIIIAVAVVALMTYMAKGALYPAERNGSTLILSMSKAFMILGWLSLFLSLVILAMLLATDGIDEIYGWLASLGFAIMGAGLIVVRRNVTIEVDDTRVRSRGLIGNWTEIPWSEIKSVRFGSISRELVLSSSSKKIKIHMYFVGFADFVRVLKTKLDPVMYRGELPAIYEEENF